MTWKSPRDSVIVNNIMFIFLYFQEIDSGNSLETEDLVMRIIRNRKLFMDRNKKKQLKELKNIRKMVYLIGAQGPRP